MYTEGRLTGSLPSKFRAWLSLILFDEDILLLNLRKRRFFAEEEATIEEKAMGTKDKEKKKMQERKISQYMKNIRQYAERPEEEGIRS